MTIPFHGPAAALQWGIYVAALADGAGGPSIGRFAPGPVHIVVGFLIVQRLFELAVSRRNSRRLKEQGGVEYGGRWDYRLMVALHVGWLLAILATVDRGTPASPVLVGVFVALQIARLWVIATLGPMWTTRVIAVPGAKRIVTGPYRFGRHPVYVVAALEIAVVPLMFGEWALALVVTALKLLVLRTRIQIENQALAEVYGD